MATMDEEYNNLSQYFPGAQILPGWAPITPLNEFIRDVGFRKSVNIGDVPVLGALGEFAGLTDESGEARLGNVVGWDDYARMNRALSQGDYGQAAISGLTGLGEVGLLASGVGKLGQAGVRGVGSLFGRGAASAAAPAATAATKTATGTADSVIGRMVQESRARAGSGATGTPAAAATGRRTISDRIPLINRLPRKYRWAAGPIAYVLGNLGMGMLEDETTPAAQPITPTTTPGSVPAVPTVPDATETLQDILASRQQQARQRILQERNRRLQDFGAEERAQLEDYLTTISERTGAQGEAVRQQARELAGLLSQDVGAIQGMGAEAESGIRRRYGQAARRARREGRQERVSSGLGGLTPVSGDIADMPRNLRGRGADLASYISENAAIAARDAGFDAATAVEYGNAVANQFAQDVALRSDAERRATEQELTQREQDIQNQFSNALLELELQGISEQSGLLEEQARAEAERNASAIPADLLLAGPTAPLLIGEWSRVSSTINGQNPEATPEDIAEAQQLSDYLNARYGAVTLEAYAQMYADNPGLLSTLLDGGQ